MFLFQCFNVSPDVRESITVLDSGFHTWSLSVELGFWLPFVIEISNSLSCIPDSTSKIFPDPLTWGIPAIRGFLIFGDKSKGLCSQGNMG